MIWKRFPHCWPFVRGQPIWILHIKGQWYGALVFSVLTNWTNCSTSSRVAGDFETLWCLCDITVVCMIETIMAWYNQCCQWSEECIKHKVKVDAVGAVQHAFLCHCFFGFYTQQYNIAFTDETQKNSVCMGLLPDKVSQYCGLRMCPEYQECFPWHWLQRKPLVSDPGMHHGTCITDVPWCILGSLTHDGGENVHGVPGACATRSFTYLERGPGEE